MSKLAIDGGSRVFPENFGFDPWPPVNEATAERLKEVYLGHKWSFYGAEEKKFAADFAHYHDAEFGTFMVNGTVTLETALLALGVGPGDEVIVPSWTWLATGMAPIYLGATPVFVDGERDTFCMDPAAFEAAITWIRSSPSPASTASRWSRTAPTPTAPSGTIRASAASATSGASASSSPRS